MMGGGMMGGFGSGFGTGGFGLLGGIIGLVFNLVLLVGIVLLVVWAVRQFSGRGDAPRVLSAGQSAPSLSAREVLSTRYAKGEISREEYQTILQDIS